MFVLFEILGFSKFSKSPPGDSYYFCSFSGFLQGTA